MKKNFYSTFFLAAIISSVSLAQDTRLLATYYGGTGNENALTVATDAFGNVFMAGITMSTGMASGGFQNTFGGGNVDAYLVKFNAAGERLWATYYGGSGDEMTFFGGKIGIATDASGNVYLAGLTNSTSGIASAGGFQNTIGGGVDGYLVKFDSSGERKWATYYGGADVDYGYSVATDPWGNAYLIGLTGSTSGIASGGFQNTIGGLGDAYLVKFDSAGNRIWATYYGGAGDDRGFSVATDASGNIYLAGATYSTSGISSGGFQNSFGGGSFDAFLVKFDSSGARLWATYYGGGGDEMMLFAGDVDVATDGMGNVFLAGLTNSLTGIASGGFQNTLGGDMDAYLVKFDSSGVRLWATYYGGSDDDKGYNVATDAQGDVYLAGNTLSASAISSGGFQNTYGSNQDGFLVKFNADGIRLCATYYGGNDFDTGEGLSIDHLGNVYTSGNTATTTGMASGGFQNSFGGGQSDGYLVKFTSCSTATQVEEVVPGSFITVYPNPAMNEVEVKLEHPDKVTGYEVTDISGKVILDKRPNKNFSEGNFTIDISELPKGIYFLRIFTGDKGKYSFKLVKNL